MSSLDYIVYPIDTDPIDLLDDAYSYMQTVIPGWTPSDGQLDVQLLQSNATIASESRDVASGVPRSIFRWFGANMMNIQPIDATSASSSVTFTMLDNLGYTVPSGTQLGLTDPFGEVIAFGTSNDLIIFPGNTTGTVNISALIQGADGSGLGTAGGPIDLLDPLTFVDHVILTAVTTGGQDAETDDEYLNRLSAELSLLAPRPILPQDFVVFAKEIPGVYRATVLNLYDPNTGTYTNDRTVTIAAVDQNGNPVSASIKADLIADLQSRREVNFKIFAIDPTMNPMAVSYRVTALPGITTATVRTNVFAAIHSYLNPATWGSVSGGTDWTNVSTVRYLELAQAINNAEGVDFITSLTFNKKGSALGTADITLTGVAPLPTIADADITGIEDAAA